MGTRYRFTVEQYLPDSTEEYKWEEVASCTGGPKATVNAMLEAAQELAAEHGIEIKRPAEQDVTAQEFQGMLEDPTQRTMIEAMFGKEMVDGLGKMASMAVALEGQPKKAGQS